MNFLKPVARVSLLDLKRSENIRTPSNIEIYNMTDKTWQENKNWYNHIMRLKIENCIDPGAEEM